MVAENDGAKRFTASFKADMICACAETYGVFNRVRPMYTSDIEKPAGTSAHRRRQVADVDVVKNSSVVTTTELSPAPRWLATIEPYTVVSGISGRSFMKTAPHSFGDRR